MRGKLKQNNSYRTELASLSNSRGTLSDRVKPSGARE